MNMGGAAVGLEAHAHAHPGLPVCLRPLRVRVPPGPQSLSFRDPLRPDLGRCLICKADMQGCCAAALLRMTGRLRDLEEPAHAAIEQLPTLSTPAALWAIALLEQGGLDEALAGPRSSDRDGWPSTEGTPGDLL